MRTLGSAFLPATAWLAAALLVACAAPRQDRDRLTRRFDAADITRVVLRAAAADTATVDVVSGTSVVTLSGRATGGAEGYHPADPRWRETPAAEWGLDFVAKRFGSTLVISTANEIGYIHHRYAVAGIGLRLPPSVELVRQVRVLTGDGKADLAPP